MKMLLTAVAALALAGTASAQQTSAPSNPQTATGAQAGASAMPAGSASRDAAAEAAGGYQPSQPALSDTPAPGAAVITTPSPSVDQAYPAPAPKRYPMCSRAITDSCRQRGG